MPRGLRGPPRVVLPEAHPALRGDRPVPSGPPPCRRSARGWSEPAPAPGQPLAAPQSSGEAQRARTPPAPRSRPSGVEELRPSQLLEPLLGLAEGKFVLG